MNLTIKIKDILDDIENATHNEVKSGRTKCHKVMLANQNSVFKKFRKKNKRENQAVLYCLKDTDWSKILSHLVILPWEQPQKNIERESSWKHPEKENQKTQNT